MKVNVVKNKSDGRGQIQQDYVKKKELILLGMGMLAVFLVAVWYVGENYSLKIWGDEFGYWQSAAYLTGKDWSSVAASNSYYGFGYGILLTPFMWLLGHDSMLMMQAALVFEAAMLTSCVAAAYLCIGYFSDQIKGVTRVLLAVLPILYPSNVLYVNLTTAEILLTTLTWWYTYVVLRFIKEKKLGLAIIIMAMSVYMYSVHQRTIAVMAISLVLIGWVYRKQIFNPKLLIVIGVLGCGMLCVMLFKKEYVSVMYAGADAALYANNNLSGQTSKVVNILTSLSGFGNFLASLIGKFYYISVASVMLAVLGFFNCIQSFFQSIKVKEDLDKAVGMVVIVLNFFASYLIAAVYMSVGYSDRTDILIYGRYIEHTIGPLIVLGILYLYECNNLKTIFAAMGITSLSAVCVDKIIGYKASNSNMWANCSAIADLFEDGYYLNGEDLYLVLLRSCIILFVLYLIFIIKNNLRDKALSIVVLSICILWTSIGFKVRNEKIVSWADAVYKDQAEVLSYIDEPEFGIYNSYMGGFFQFLRVDSKVQYYASMEDIENSSKSMYIITYKKAEDIEEIREEQDIFFENGRYVVWKSNVR